ncbi:MAG: SIR2 family protein [Isosphaeraceae bacterium]
MNEHTPSRIRARPDRPAGDADDLIEALRRRNVLLFVGAGVSMNLGIPSWAELSGLMAEELGRDPADFRAMGDDQTLAEFYALERGSIGSLCRWMERAWHENAEAKVLGSEVHRLIVRLGFPVIYTTNFDRYLELAHEAHGVPYARVASLGDLAQAPPGVTQIVKLHGDLSDEASVVLTESSHFERLSLDGPLDVRLRSELLTRDALFIGYSLSDVSIRYLIYRLHRLWKGSPHEGVRPRAYVFLGRPNPVQARVLSNWGIVPLVSEGADIGEGLRKLLEHLHAGAAAGPEVARA